MKKSVVWSLILVTSLSASAIITGCGSNQSAPTTASTANNSSSDTAATKAATPTVKLQHVVLTVLPGGKLGSDGKKHDAFSPSDFELVKGVPVELTIYNYDNMPHSVTSPDMKLNLKAVGSKKDGDPGVSTIKFTPEKTGEFTWYCAFPCDKDNNQWSMSQFGYMKGKIKVIE